MPTFNEPFGLRPQNEIEKVEEVMPEEEVRRAAAYLVANQGRFLVGGTIDFALLQEVMQEWEDNLP